MVGAEVGVIDDCTNVETACFSIAAVLDMDQADLHRELLAYSPARYEEDCRSSQEEPYDVLWKQILGTRPWPVPDSIIWFHATRVPPGIKFNNGILPLNEREKPLTELLLKLATSIGVAPRSGDDNDDEAARSQAGFHYSLKTTNPLHRGPYAFLTRDAIVDRGSSTGHYTAVLNRTGFSL
jgi:hypothetical protein